MKSFVSRLASVLATLLVVVSSACADDESDAYETYYATQGSYNAAATRFANANIGMNNSQAWYFALSVDALIAYQANEISEEDYDSIEAWLEEANNDLIEIGGLLNSVNVPPAWSVREKKVSAAVYLDNAENFLGVGVWASVMTECGACSDDVASMDSGLDEVEDVFINLGEILNHINGMLPPAP